MKSFRILIYLFFITQVFSQVNSIQNLSADKNEFYITLTDGVKLDCTEFVPGSATNSKLPAVIFCHGFGGSKTDVEGFAQTMAEKGIVTFCYSMRGQGKSTGFSNLISRTEMNDLMRVVDFIKKDSIVDSSNVGILGSSQGGIVAFMAGCYGESFKFIVSDLSSPEFASNWIENGCVKTTLIWSLLYDSTKVRYNNEVINFRKWILSGRKDYRDSIMTYFPKERDFPNRVKYLNSPILFSNSWQDKFFNSQGLLNIISEINVPFRAYFGVVPGHGSDTVYNEILYHSKNIDEWINQWLFDEDNTQVSQNKIVYASSISPINFHHWNYIQSFSNIWPPDGTSDIRFYFHSGQRLGYEADITKQDTISILNDVRVKKLKMIDALKCNFTGNDFNNKFFKTYIYFETNPLEKGMKMVGSPKLNIFYSSDVDICQLNFQIWEVEPNGQMNFVSRINFTDWNSGNFVKYKYIYGDAQSHIFKQGNKIRIYITNIDNGPYDEFLRSNPYVLPVLKRVRSTIYIEGEKASYVEIPFVN